MKWSEISVDTRNEAVEAVSHILQEAGAGGVVIEDSKIAEQAWESKFGEVYEFPPNDNPADERAVVKAYLPVSDDLQDKVEAIKQRVQGLAQYQINFGTGAVSQREVKEEDWATAWKKYYKPVHVSDGLTITPSWEAYQTPPEREGEKIIELDPGMAFGTGTHPTTMLCMRQLENIIQPGDQVIDVGCGSGVLSITAVKLGASRVLALDLDDVAVHATQQNAQLNHANQGIEARQNDLLQGIEETANVVVSNILAEVIVTFTDDVARVLTSDGTFVASGIIQEKEAVVKEAMEQSGLRPVETFTMDDWVAIVAKKM